MADRQPERRQADTGNVNHKPSVMPAWSIWVGVVVVFLVAAGAMWALFSLFGTGTPADKIRLEIIKLAGSVVIGTGGAAALLLAARRQRSTELSLIQTEQDLAYKAEAAADARHDAVERRATELYTAAAEQLGSDKAPVRLAGLYALERFGQANVEYRQTVVNLLCAYLRMPFARTDSQRQSSRSDDDSAKVREQARPTRDPLVIDLTPSLSAAIGASANADDQQRQELEVRLTAQRILTDHLQPPIDATNEPTRDKFWKGMHLNLTGAVLDGFNMYQCHAQRANFERAEFHGYTTFQEASFDSAVFLDDATFYDLALFNRATFRSMFSANSATFYGNAIFSHAQFELHSCFIDATFRSHFSFSDAHFRGPALLEGATFHGNADFQDAEFRHIVSFGTKTPREYSQDGVDIKLNSRPTGATFHHGVLFDGTCFRGPASLEKTTFHEKVSFTGAAFHNFTSFDAANLQGDTDFRGAKYRLDVDRDKGNWPKGLEMGTTSRVRAAAPEDASGAWAYVKSPENLSEA